MGPHAVSRAADRHARREAPPPVRVTYDAAADVLYALVAGAAAVDASAKGRDPYVVTDRDARGRVVGVRVLAAGEMPAEFWPRHPDRAGLPALLRDAVGAWFAGRG